MDEADTDEDEIAVIVPVTEMVQIVSEPVEVAFKAVVEEDKLVMEAVEFAALVVELELMVERLWKDEVVMDELKSEVVMLPEVVVLKDEDPEVTDVVVFDACPDGVPLPFSDTDEAEVVVETEEVVETELVSELVAVEEEV